MPAGTQLRGGQLVIYCWWIGRPKGALLQLAVHVECLFIERFRIVRFRGHSGFCCRSWMFCICEDRVAVYLEWGDPALVTGHQCNVLQTGDKFCHGVSLHNAIASSYLKKTFLPSLGIFRGVPWEHFPNGEHVVIRHIPPQNHPLLGRTEWVAICVSKVLE